MDGSRENSMWIVDGLDWIGLVLSFFNHPHFSDSCFPIHIQGKYRRFMTILVNKIHQDPDGWLNESGLVSGKHLGKISKPGMISSELGHSFDKTMAKGVPFFVEHGEDCRFFLAL